jgi:hypothetical protein
MRHFRHESALPRDWSSLGISSAKVPRRRKLLSEIRLIWQRACRPSPNRARWSWRTQLRGWLPVCSRQPISDKMKGFAAPIQVWQITGEAAAENRFAARHRVLAPLVGRETELAFLLERTQTAPSILSSRSSRGRLRSSATTMRMPISTSWRHTWEDLVRDSARPFR